MNKGQAMVEYVFMIALIVLVVIVLIVVFGQQLAALYQDIVDMF